MTDSTSKPSSRGAALLDSIKSFTSSIPTGVGSFQHTLRQQAAAMNPSQHPDTLKIQMAIKAQRGIVLDEQALARETALFSKHIYLWGKDESFEQAPDLVDVSDRLAYLLFASSELDAAYAIKVEQARIPLKELRNLQNDEVVPKRRQRDQLTHRIAQLKEKDATRNADEIVRLQAELLALTRELETSERTADGLKRTKLHESFSALFAAQRELGEKKAIIAGYGELLLRELEGGFGTEYHGQETTAQIKGELGEALKAWDPEHPKISLPTLSVGGPSWRGRSEAGTFHETHGDQLKAVHPESPANTTLAPPIAVDSTTHLGSSTRRPVPPPPALPITGAAISTSRDPFADPTRPAAPARSLSTSSASRINLSPTPVDLGPSYTPPTSPLPADPIPEMEGVPPGPTIAETGVPIVGAGGPASGQLRPRAPSAAGERPIPLMSLGGSAFSAPSSSSAVPGSEPSHSKEQLEAARAAQLAAVDRARDEQDQDEELPAYRPVKE